MPEVLCTETIYDHQTESFRIYDLQNVSYLQRPKVRNCLIIHCSKVLFIYYSDLTGIL